jgi:SpoVK/Ycf46/Vps4 family AAA+-type ATPase
VALPPPDGEALLAALKWLDAVLARATATADALYGASGMRDPFRGLHISDQDVAQLLARGGGAPTLHSKDGDPLDDLERAASAVPRLTWLVESFGLSTFDLGVIVVALGPELDLGYERLYGYLQDDVTRRRPSVNLALDLLCQTAGDKLARRRHFASDAPLIRHDLVRLISDPNQVDPPLLARAIKLDEQILRLLASGQGIDPRLAPFCELIEPTASFENVPLDPDVGRTLVVLAAEWRNTHRPVRLYFQGPHGAGQLLAAEALAREASCRLLTTELGRATAIASEFETTIDLLFREAWLLNAVLFLGGADAIRPDESAAKYARLMNGVAQSRSVTILVGSRPWMSPQSVSGTRATGVVTVEFPIPAFEQRRALWAELLRREELDAEPDAVEAVADRYRLVPGQIHEATRALRNLTRLRGGTERVDRSPDETDRVDARDLFAAARLQTGHDLGSLARKIDPRYAWQDIVLPADALAQLREICQRVVHHRVVLDQWGFGRKLSHGKGVNALFTGPSGTGKTMAAEILGHELNLDLYKIDLSAVVSKWIGETEKNLDRIFTAAENANAILFFDEADALFGKRSEVRDSHDRYANVEISYLLQKMEEYEGIAILATNLRANLDEAFVRRLAFTVQFPFPDDESRRRIWTGIWPAATPVGDDVDAAFLAKQFKLSGGNIKNIALAAAVLAAAEGGVVRMAHVLHATRREYQKMGKVLADIDVAHPIIEVQIVGRR